MKATYYQDSKGNLLAIHEMDHKHLVAAHAKLERDAPEREEEIAAMAAQIATNGELHASRRAELEAEGVFVIEGDKPGGNQVAGFIACQADGEPVPETWARSEDATWRLAWTKLNPAA